VSNLVTYTTRSGQVRTYSYDTRNREIQSVWSDSTPSITRTYDAASRLLTLVSSVSALSYTYDDADEVTSETQTVAGAPGPGKTVRYTYTPDSLRATLTYPAGTVVSYAYTGRNQVATITADGPPPLVTYTYDLNGNRVSKAVENSTTTGSAFDAVNRLVSIDHQRSAVSFAQLDYGYDVVNRRTFVQRDDALGDVFAYDAIDQVTAVQYDVTNPDTSPSNPARTVQYALDRVGNRTVVTENGVQTSYTANTLNEYTHVGASTLTYDGNGNLTSDDGTTNSYDAQNRLTRAVNGTNSVTCAFDPLNRCVHRTVNGVSTFLYYDDWNLIEERAGSDASLARYVHGAEVDEILVRETTGGPIYYQHDALQDVTRLTDGAGTVVEHYTYDIYGAVTITDALGHPLSASAVGNRFLFTGRELLAEIGLYDYRNRMYAADLGRFLQPDPLGLEAPDVNLYAYVGNNPTNSVDSEGLKACYSSCVRGQTRNQRPIREVYRIGEGKTEEDAVKAAKMACSTALADPGGNMGHYPTLWTEKAHDQKKKRCPPRPPKQRPGVIPLR
jgi:RHS repeat-associated protein